MIAIVSDDGKSISFTHNGKKLSRREGFQRLEIGKAECLREGSDVAILGVGPLLYKAKEAADILQQQGISAAVANMRFVKPLDVDMIKRLSHVKLMVTVEENSLVGGFGSAVAEYLMDSGLSRNLDLLRLGLPDKFIEQGTQEELLTLCGLQPEQMAMKIKERLNRLHIYNNYENLVLRERIHLKRWFFSCFLICIHKR